MRSRLASLPLVALALISANSDSAVAAPLIEGIAQPETAEAPASQRRTVVVDCTRNRKIQSAVDRDERYLTVVVRGTCTENVIIRRDNITLIGKDETSGITGSVSVQGGRRVVVERLRVLDNTATEGAVEVLPGSEATLRDLTIERAFNRGVLIVGAEAYLEDVSVDDSGTVGVLVRGSTIRLEGEITVTNSVEGGLVLTGATSGFSRDGIIRCNNNVLGLVVQSNSALEAVFGSITANNNQAVGVFVSSQGVLNYGVTLTIEGNTGVGMVIDEDSSVSVFLNLTRIAQTTIRNNAAAGVVVEEDGSLELDGVTSITANPIGIQVDDAALRMRGANITGNGTDLRLRFGYAVSFRGTANAANTLVCDNTGLTRGPISCPPPAP